MTSTYGLFPDQGTRKLTSTHVLATCLPLKCPSSWCIIFTTTCGLLTYLWRFPDSYHYIVIPTIISHISLNTMKSLFASFDVNEQVISPKMAVFLFFFYIIWRPVCQGLKHSTPCVFHWTIGRSKHTLLYNIQGNISSISNSQKICS